MDSISVSTTSDSTKVSNSVLDDIVIYPSRDSTVMDLKNQVVKLYGDAEVKYQDITLKADYIQFSFSDLSVKAYGMPDTAGTVIGKPDFSQGQDQFKADTINYNFKSEKGLIKQVRTSEGESLVHTNVSKKQANNDVHNYKGKLTTCDAEKPHFHFAFNKLIVKPNDKVITGPIIMKVGSVPTPLALPFGFFPNTTRRKAGIILPNYGQSNQLGFYLLGGGYYLPINQNWDTQLTGNIYSRGSWGLANLTRYVKKYKYTGNFRLNYDARITGDREIPNDFSRNNSFGINWSHNQSSKARPGTTFSASVNIATSNNNTNNFNTSQSQYLNNTLTSTIRYAKNFPNKPYNFSANFRHSQNTLNRSFSLTIPNFTFNVNRFFLPLTFLKKEGVTKQRFYEKIGVTYNSNFENRINTTEPELRFDNLSNLRTQFVNGIRHNLSVGTSLKMGYITFNPSFNMTERWHFQRLQRTLNSLDSPFDKPFETEEIRGGFFTTRDYSMGGNFTTKIYGMFNLNSKKIQAIRHTMTPSIGFFYNPEFDFEEFVENSNSTDKYNPFGESAFPQSNRVNSGNVNFRLVNSIESKMRVRNDSVSKYEKVRLIENFSISTAYNLFADSLNLRDITMSGRTRLFKKIDINYSGTYDPYQNDSLGRKIDRFRWQDGGDWLRNVNTRIAIGGSLKSNRRTQPRKEVQAAEEDFAEIERQRNSFVDFSIPWSTTLNYTLNIINNLEVTENGVEEVKNIQQAVMARGDFTVFEKWKVGFDTGYDFTAGEFTPTTLNLIWDLHCWEFAGSIIPFGQRQSFTMSLRVKSALLKDLNLQARGALGEQFLLF
ncbi:MAG: putative LPS assembly protein LptD [Bacteroidota bacterium]